MGENRRRRPIEGALDFYAILGLVLGLPDGFGVRFAQFHLLGKRERISEK